MNKFPVQAGNEMRKEFRGVFDYRYDELNGIFGFVWKDNIVKMLSNNLDVLPLGCMQRWSKAEKNQVLFPRPDAILNYSTNIGSVDNLDWNINTKAENKK
ncbi:piggyBac transposable element-derived protein 2 [Nephila pilipes]|uniref:PiggyBac transposable element-derived protein 2 n=1 Tax=Nephila pilipes TaxID=299642 RepID=A0A8X6T2S2_NEPPI|nr:piggyBac transposable element-derived protein 2 [Nephila pilipes]